MTTGTGTQVKLGCGVLVILYLLYAAAFQVALGDVGGAALLAIPILLVGTGLYRLWRHSWGAATGNTDRAPVTDRLERLLLSDRVARQRERLEAVLKPMPVVPSATTVSLRDAVVRLQGVSSALERVAYERTGGALRPDESDAEAVRSIDDLLGSQTDTLERQVDELIRSLGDRPDPAIVGALHETISILQRGADERARVLITPDDQSPLPTPAELLRGVGPDHLYEPSRFISLNAGDALSYEGDNYFLVARLDWADGEKVWQTYALDGGPGQLWLLVERGGTGLTILRQSALPQGLDGATAGPEGGRWRTVEGGTATVTVTGAAGRRPGLLIGYRRYEGPAGLLWVEEWGEGPKAMLGTPERAESFELWPKQRPIRQ